jgi:hypothetical protein
MTIDKNLILCAVNCAAGSSLTGAFGALLVPASAAAAGGVLNVAVACAVGGFIAGLPSTYLLLALTLGTAGAISIGQKILGAIGAALTAAALVGCFMMAAWLGAIALGMAAWPVITCSLTGLSVMFAIGVGVGALSAMTIAGSAALFAATINNGPLVS